MERGRFGRIYMVNVNVFWSGRRSYYDSAAWRGTWEFDGGALHEPGEPLRRPAGLAVGPVESVQAYTGTLARDIQVEDTGVVGAQVAHRRARLDQRDHAHLSEEPRGLDHRSSARRARVRIGGVAVNEIQHWEFADAARDGRTGQGRELRDDLGLRLRPSAVLRQRHLTLRGEAEAETDGREGLRSLELLIATVPVGARRPARAICRWSTEPWLHYDPSDGHRRRRRATIGDGCRVWHWVHICAGARIGAGCSFGQNVFVGNDVAIGNNVKIQNNVRCTTT